MAYVGTAQSTGDLKSTLASIIQGEAGNQGLTGMQAVGAVISNRASVNLNGYGSDLLSQATAPYQFQGQATPSPAAYGVAQDVINGTNPDPTGGALYYANPSASSASWATNLNSSNALQIGDHYFTNNTNGVPFTPNFSPGVTTASSTGAYTPDSLDTSNPDGSATVGYGSSYSTPLTGDASLDYSGALPAGSNSAVPSDAQLASNNYTLSPDNLNPTQAASFDFPGSFSMGSPSGISSGNASTVGSASPVTVNATPATPGTSSNPAASPTAPAAADWESGGVTAVETGFNSLTKGLDTQINASTNNATAALTANAATWITDAGDWFLRGGIMILGFILIIFALYWVMPKQPTLASV